MNKRIITLLITLALALIVPITVFAEKADYVVDKGKLLSSSEEEELTKKLEALSEKYEFDIVALTVDDLEGKNPMEYADDYYDYNGYRNDGCLLLISTDRDWWISTKGYGITAITDYGIDVLEQEAIRNYFGNDDWAGGFNKYANMIEEYLVQAKSGLPYDTNNTYTTANGYTYDFSSDYETDSSKENEKTDSFIISLIVAAVIAAIITLMVKSNYKPVRFRANATDYLVDGSLNVTQQYDRFLFSNVSKTKIESSSSSGGGSSTHTSSSGSTHGGGGGKF